MHRTQRGQAAGPFARGPWRRLGRLTPEATVMLTTADEGQGDVEHEASVRGGALTRACTSCDRLPGVANYLKGTTRRGGSRAPTFARVTPGLRRHRRRLLRQPKRLQATSSRPGADVAIALDVRGAERVADADGNPD
jgi:hypothetical protein